MQEDKKREGPKRLLIDIDEDLHNKIKLCALKRNITLRRWVTRAILQAIKQEEQYE